MLAHGGARAASEPGGGTRLHRTGRRAGRPGARRAWSALRAAGVGLVSLGAIDARAVSLDFDALPSPSDAAAASSAAVAVGTNLVLSQADAALATGLDTTGWATTPANGVLNTYETIQSFVFATPVSEFGVDVVGLPDGIGGFTTVLLQAFRGATLVGIDILDTGLIGPSGAPQQRLLASGLAFELVTLTPVRVSGGELPCFTLVDEPSTFFFDTVSYTPVPEPTTALLVLAGVAHLARIRRER